jgi:predicted MFS family arabinose efflux permease
MLRIPTYGFTFTAPVIILQLGYTSAQAQLLTIPVYLLGTISTLAFSWIADRRQTRWPFIVIPYSISLVGFIGLMAIPRSLPGLTYAFLFLIPAGVFPAVISLVSWVSNNLSPTWKRAIGIATSIMMGNFGGAIGSNIYLARESPVYWTGYGVSVAMLANAILCTLVLRYLWKRENERRDKIPVEEIRQKYTERTLLLCPGG